MSNQAVDVEILGKLTRVNCPAGQEEALTQAAEDLDNRLKELSSRTKVTNELQLLTFAALNICYEMQTKQQESDGKENAISKKIEKLTASLDKALSQARNVHSLEEK